MSDRAELLAEQQRHAVTKELLAAARAQLDAQHRTIVALRSGDTDQSTPAMGNKPVDTETLSKRWTEPN